jgi:hypothetical protein
MILHHFGVLEWLEYNKCIGFRYNISGAYTRLKSYICLMEEGGTCQVQVMRVFLKI